MDKHYFPYAMKYLANPGGGIDPSSSSKSFDVTDVKASSRATTRIAVVGLGYVGLPTALSLHDAGFDVAGLDISRDRIEAIRDGRVDAASTGSSDLGSVLASDRFSLSADADVLTGSDVVLIAVPTPVDGSRAPDMRALEGACESYVRRARKGQTVILTSTTYVGCTSALLAEPLRSAGFGIGTDIHVAFSPERLNPGSESFTQSDVPRVIGGVTPECTAAAAEVLGSIASSVHLVSSPDVAEMTKLVENTFRAVNIALANEFAEASTAFGIDVREVLDASASKPYGFMSFRPGPGVGGHCIPCDPHYLLWGLHSERVYAPVVEQAMVSISSRPLQVVDRIDQLLRSVGRPLEGARVLLVGLSYKPGVQDVRESPSIVIATLLRHRGAMVAAHDALVQSDVLDGDGRSITRCASPSPDDFDLAVVLTDQSNADTRWLDEMSLILDASFAMDRTSKVFSL